MTRWRLINARTQYPIEELKGEPMTEPEGSAVTCPTCKGTRLAVSRSDGHPFPGYNVEGAPCPTCNGRGFIRRRSISVRGETPEAAALALLEAQGFELFECCADLEPGEKPCDECRRDGEESTEEGRL